MKNAHIRRSGAGILMATCLFALAIHAQGSNPSPKAYVAEFGSNNIAVVDTAKNEVLKRIPVPKGAHGVVITPDGSRVFASSDESSVITVIDTANDTQIASIPTGKAPHGLTVTKDGKFVYAGIFGDNQILEINAQTLRVERTFDVPAPHNIAVSGDSKVLFAASQQASNTGIAQIDLSSGKMISLLPTNTVPRSLNLSPDGSILTVTEFDRNDLQVFSTRPLKLLTTVDVGSSPHHTIFTGDGKLVLVTNQTSNDVSLVDTKSWKVTGKINVGQKPHWIALSSDGNYAYITDEASGQLSVVDLKDQKVDATIALGSMPRKIAIQPGTISEAKSESSDSNTDSKNVVVKMQGPPPRFIPENLVIQAGTTVEWINTGDKMHTVTDEHSAWDSGALEPGEKFSHRFDQKGTFNYYCIPHRNMKMVGSITVQ